jgi:Fe2+ or Zn2+ uptake regulation protein
MYGFIVVRMQSPAALAAIYRSQGRKITPQRQLLFQLMHENDRHPTAEALFAEASAQMPGISLRTVYQTLNELAEMGELQFIDIGGGATRFDPNLEDHHHVVCTDCGQIRDVHVKGTAALRPLDLEDFTVSEVGVVFQGVCSSCEKSRAKTGRSVHAKSPALQAKVSK